MQFRHVFFGILVEVGKAVFAAEFDRLAVVREDVGLIAQVIIGDDAFGQWIRSARSRLHVIVGLAADDSE